MNKEEAVLKIKRLEEIYNYYWEVYSRTTSQYEKEKAKIKYQEAIEENIRLQNKYGLHIPPRYSKSDRAKMQLDSENELLVISDSQVIENNKIDEFENDKKNLVANINNILQAGNLEFVNEIKEYISSMGSLSELKGIKSMLEEVSFLNKGVYISPETMTLLSSPIFLEKIAKFLSGEMLIESLENIYNDALNEIASNHSAKAEEIFINGVEKLKKATEYTVLESGKNYFNLRLNRINSDLQLAIIQYRNQKERERMKIDLKQIIIDQIDNNPGIMQVKLYEMLNIYEKSEISETCYFLTKENKIRREKQGRTYKLFLSNR